MRLKCPACNVEAVKRGRADHWTCPECHAVIEEPSQETCLAILAGEIDAEEFNSGDMCADCRQYRCPVKPVDAEEKDMRDELSSMFGDDEEALQAFEEGYDPEKD